MRWLKSLVIVLGFLIVGGVVLLAYGFVKKTQDPDWRLSDLIRDTPRAAAEKTPAPPPAPASVAAANPAPTPTPQPFGDVNLGLDTGCVVTDVAPAGDRAYLTIGPPGPCHRVIVVYIAAGRVLGTIRPGR